MPLSAQISLPLGPEAARLARRMVGDVLASWGVCDGDAVYDLQLVVSELVGNAVRHSATSVGLRLELDGEEVTLAVSDGSAVLPVARDADDAAEGGRGLAILSAVATAWGVESEPHGKVVWARLPTGPLRATGPTAG